MSVRLPCLESLGLLSLMLLCGCAPSAGESAAANRSDAPVANAAGTALPLATDAAQGDAPAALNVAATLPPPTPKAVKVATPLDLPASNAAAASLAFPAEVTSFMVDRDGCDHFRGEEPYDAERAAYLDESIRELCTGTDARLARLRKRYVRDADVIAALASYEDAVEQPPEQP